MQTMTLRWRSVVIFLVVSLVVLLFMGLLLPLRLRSQAAPRQAVAPSHKNESRLLPPHLDKSFGKFPLRFEANHGQTDSQVKFLARTPGMALFLTPAEAVFRLQTRARSDGEENMAVLRAQLLGANPMAAVRGLDELTGRSNYLLGDNPHAWRTNVANFAAVQYDAVYPGVDLRYYGNGRELEYDFRLAPGADPRQLRIAFTGLRAMWITRRGDLILSVPGGQLRQRAPLVYQEINGRRRTVRGRFRITGRHQVGFALGKYDRRRPLVIDPVLIYSSVLGGSSTDVGLSVAVDAMGSAYLTGYTVSTDFPQAKAWQTTNRGNQDIFVTKLNPAGNALVYSTYLGGAATDQANALALDQQGNVYLTGFTASTDFPRTPGALLSSLPGLSSAFVTKLNAQGSGLVYSTYLGGNSIENGQGIAVDAQGNAYIAGSTDSTQIPIAGITNGRAGNPLLKSSDSGNTWAASVAGLERNSVFSLAVAPSDAKTMYAGTNIGLVKSTDAGATWQAINSNIPATTLSQVRVLAVDPLNAEVLYTASSFSFYKSTDGGKTFTLKTGGITNFPTYLSFALDPSNPAVIYLGTDRGVFKTANGGDAWVPINAGFSQFGSLPRVNALAIDPTNPQTVYAGVSGGVFKTTNGGTNWVAASTGLRTGSITLLVLDPAAPNTLYAGASSYSSDFPVTLYKSTNGGAQWNASGDGFSLASGTQVFPLFPSALALDPTNPQRLFVGANGYGVYRTTDGGANWSAANTGLTNTQLNALVVDRNTNVFAGTTAGTDAFVAKLKPDGTALDYFKLFAGYESDTALDIAVDAAGNAVVGGSTSSTNFPLVNALQPQKAAGVDAFVLKLNALGVTQFSTFLGGNGNDSANAMTMDSEGNVYLTGATSSTTFPLANAWQKEVKFPASSLGEAFVTKLQADGQKLIYSTYLGGTGNDFGDGIAVDKMGNAYVVGGTTSIDFPTFAAPQKNNTGSQDAFAVKFNATGTTMLYGTYLGGTSSDAARAVALDAAGSAYVVGFTSSTNFPLQNPLNPGQVIRSTEAFITKLGLLADLALNKTDSRDPVMVNNDLLYTLTVNNNGPDTADNVVVTDTLPADVTFVSAVASQGKCSGTTTVLCDVGELHTQATATITITVKPTRTGVTLTNRASVTSATSDPNASNNTAQQTTRVSALPSIAGRITFADETAANAVNVGLSGSSTSTATTDSTGQYQFPDLPLNGNYTVTPTRAGQVFRPPSQSLNNITADQTANFRAIRCIFTLNPQNQSFPASGGTGTVQIVSPDSQCPWTARSNAEWITLTSATTGNGSSVLTFQIAPTVGARSGTITVAGNTFTVWQEFNACAQSNFDLPLTFPGFKDVFMRYQPARYVARDFNRDGYLDLVFATGFFPAGLALALGQEDGFAPQQDLIPYLDSSRENFSEIDVRDVDGDGKLDLLLAATNDAGGRVLVWRGDDTGKFAAPVASGVGAGTNSMAVADFNGDGKPDLAVAGSRFAVVSILLNEGGGSFSLPRELPANGSLATGDFNGDGKADLAVGGTNTLSLFLGNGTGRFAPAVAETVNSVASLLSGDFTQDGLDDLVFTSSTGLMLRPGQRTDRLGAETKLADGGLGLMLTGDLNQDGILDLAGSGGSEVAVLLSQGKGRFAPLVRYLAGNFNESTTSGAPRLALGDWNRDGVMDILSLGVVTTRAEFGASNTYGLSVLLAREPGQFIAPRSYPFVSSYGYGNIPGTALGDVNGDSNPDLAVGYSPDKIAVLLGTDLGEFGPAVNYTVPNFQRFLYLRDCNQDGKLDLIALTNDSDTFTVLLNDGKGNFPTRVTTSLAARVSGIEAGDWNNDGNPDFVLTTQTSGVPSGLLLVAGNGAGGFTRTVPSFSAQYKNPIWKTGDFNGDGNLDLAVQSSEFSGCSSSACTLSVLAGDGKGGFQVTSIAPLSTSLAQVESNDLNADGRADLLYQANGLWAMLADPRGGFAAPVQLTTGGENPHLSAIRLADFNGDGKADLLGTYSSVGDLALRFGNGDASFKLPSFLPLTLASSSLYPVPAAPIVADLNGDGYKDVVVSREGLGRVAVLLNRAGCRPPDGLVTTSAASYRPNRVASGAIAAAFGARLANETVQATSRALSTSLGGVSVKVKDIAGTERLAALFFVSPQQINFLVPTETKLGAALVSVSKDGATVASGTVQVVPASPGLFAANADGQGVATAQAVHINSFVVQKVEDIAQYDTTRKKFVARPIDLGPTGTEVYLLLYGTGIRGRSSLAGVTVQIGGVPAPVEYADVQREFVGLDQVNIRLPRSLAGRGDVDIVLSVDGKIANTVRMKIK